MRVWAALGLGLGCVTSCGSPAGGTSPAAPTTPASTAAAAAPTAAPSLPKPRTASAELRRYWAFSKEAFHLYADWAGFSRTELASNLKTPLFDLASIALDAKQQVCLETLYAHAHEVAAAGYWLGLSFEPSALKPVREPCLEALHARPTDGIEGASEAYELGRFDEAWGTVLVVDPSGVVLYGPRAVVEHALRHSPQPWPEALVLAPDQYLVVTTDVRPTEANRYTNQHSPLEGTRGHAHLTTNARELGLSATVALPDEGLAQQVHTSLDEQRRAAADSFGDVPVVRRLIEAFALRREGARLDADFRLVGSPKEQAQALVDAAALGANALRSYVTNAKMAEAAATLADITRRYLEHVNGRGVDRRGLPFAKGRLPAFPAVPAQVPAGVLAQTTPADWSAWQSLPFGIAESQRYQYEIIVSPDGRSATIVARGDLDGDGRLAEFSRRITFDAKLRAFVATDEIAATEPTE